MHRVEMRLFHQFRQPGAIQRSGDLRVGRKRVLFQISSFFAAILDSVRFFFRFLEILFQAIFFRLLLLERPVHVRLPNEFSPEIQGDSAQGDV